MRHPLSNHLGISVEDPAVVCLYWSLLDRFGSGLAHVCCFLRRHFVRIGTGEGGFQGQLNLRTIKKCTEVVWCVLRN